MSQANRQFNNNINELLIVNKLTIQMQWLQGLILFKFPNDINAVISDAPRAPTVRVPKRTGSSWNVGEAKKESHFP